METFTVPFAIGDVKWLPAHQPRKVEVPCPVCFGNLSVVVTLGNGEEFAVLCEGCGLGFNGPQGTIQQYEYEPAAIRFEIARVESMHGTRWRVGSVAGGSANYDELVETEEEALAISRQKCADHQEANMRSLQRTRDGSRRLTWSVRYHNEKIADLERQLEWHRAKAQKVKRNAQR
jgi:hypothetical protein